MTQESNGHRFRPSSTAWTVIASVALAAFTVFVLLDTFVLTRVQQSVQEADLSSIVAAQEAASESLQAASAEGGDGETADGSDAGASDGDSDAGSASGSSEGAANATADTSETGSSSGSATSQSHRHGKKGHRPGGTHGERSSQEGGSNASSGSSSDNAHASGSSKSGASASSDSSASQLVAGSGSAESSGTQIGSYSDDNIKIEVSSLRAYDTDIYVADIQVSSAEYLKTALAQNSFGRNLKDTTSNMAEQAGAILAINGDYYGFRDEGYVIRNGVLYRDAAAAGTDALVVYGDGSMASVSQDSTSAQELKDSGAWQVLSFGPTLVEDGKLAVAAGDEVSQSRSSNPRTAIGMVSPLHYVVVVSDGRTGENSGLTLEQLAQVLVDNGATYAYNLDGGGSTTLYFKGEVINNPTSGNVGGERSVSDIVYFG